jgi:hypothetical protein
MQPLPRHGHRPGADEYEGISTFPLAPLLALACFAAALASRYLVGLVPPELRPLPRPFLSALVTPAFAVVGLLFALAGLRSSARGTARLALALNGIVLGLSVLAIVAFFVIYPDPLRLFRGF